MVKHIELNPEWILTELPQSICADGNGVICVDTDNSTDASWIKLALKTLCIPFEENEYGDEDLIFIDIEFNIEDLKKDCPILYKNMKNMDAKNKIYRYTNLN
jgi:ribosome biogenesis SPOUT family RNA methylase Rps3